MPIAPDFFWHTLPAPRHDLRQRLEDFETKEQVKERSASLCRVLEKGNWQHKRLAKRLRRCRQKKRCLAVPCPRCRRRYRLWCVGEKLRLWGRRGDVLFVTLIPPDLRLQQGGLEGFEPRKFMERVRRQMQRAGLGGIAIAGGVDVSWEEDGNGEREGVWQPHLHLIVAGCETKQIKKALDRHYQPTAEVPQPLKIQKVEDAVRQFSYCHKPFWTRRVSWTDEEGKRHRGPPLGLKVEQQREAALFGSRLRPGELVMLSGVRQRGSRLVGEE